ncbi:hypothetical protein BH10ACI1_BH10ACI1_10700 [soil metagenome]
MKYIRNFLILSFAFLMLFAFDAKAQMVGSSSRSIEQKIFKKLIGLPYYGVFDHISYQVNGGTVTLSGKVLSLGVKKSAERAVKEIEGVTEVVNNIENLSPSPYDNRIRYDVVREFAARGGNLSGYLQEPNPSVRIIVDGGRVTLEGYVRTRGDSDLANILANGIAGVFKVTNNLIIEKEMVR